MIKRWLIYLGVLVIALIFYFAYRQWLAWLALVFILCLPVVGLLLSLPAMLGLKLTVHGPSHLSAGAQERLALCADCDYPQPPFRGSVRVRRVTTGEKWHLKEAALLPTEHCGLLECRPEKARVYDYLGLFFLKIRQIKTHRILIRPIPVPVQCLPDLQRYLAGAWRPKPGGGFAENHELRLYRPGDSLNQVHWKLSAKMGNFIIREAMMPQKSRMLLSLEVRGTAWELDRKFGRLLWLSRDLLRQELRHEICALTGTGTHILPVDDEQSLLSALDTLLSSPPASPDAQWPEIQAAWQYRIGGDEDEA